MLVCYFLSSHLDLLVSTMEMTMFSEPRPIPVPPAYNHPPNIITQSQLDQQQILYHHERVNAAQSQARH